MDIRRITDTYAVSPQIAPDDVPEVKAQGFVAIICNRPDAEVGQELSSAAIQTAAAAAGLAFVDNPVVNGAMGPEQIAAQARAIAAADGPVLAYCRSGTRSCFVWAFGAAVGTDPDTLITQAGQAGYDLSPALPQLKALSDSANL